MMVAPARRSRFADAERALGPWRLPDDTVRRAEGGLIDEISQARPPAMFAIPRFADSTRTSPEVREGPTHKVAALQPAARGPEPRGR
jgi:hypothetical protein